jgi:flagellar motor switch/type III secretory pathway protein FliN
MPATPQAAVTAPQPPPAAPKISPSDAKSDPRWRQAVRLPCSVSILVPMPGFKVKDLLGLRSKSVVASHWPTTDNLPVKVNGELIGWCEFEVLGNRLAARLTELA